VTGPVGFRESCIRFVTRMHNTPALLLDRHLDVLAVSPLAATIAPEIERGVNLARVGVIAADRVGPPMDERTSSDLAALLRDGISRFHEDSRFVTIVGELVATSSSFSRAWAESKRGPFFGRWDRTDDAIEPLRLDCVRLQLDAEPDLTLVLACARDDESAQRLALLSDDRRRRGDRDDPA
jgi:hypothetical protein